MTERITLRLPEELKNKLDKRARELGVSLNSLIVQILWEHFEQMNMRRAAQ